MYDFGRYVAGAEPDRNPGGFLPLLKPASWAGGGQKYSRR